MATGSSTDNTIIGIAPVSSLCSNGRRCRKIVPRLVASAAVFYDLGMSEQAPYESDGPASRQPWPFGSAIVDRAREAGNVLTLPSGQIMLPEVFGFCRGVERALEMLDAAVSSHLQRGTRLFLLGEIIHNPWVNQYLQKQGVRILSPDQRDQPEKHLAADDCVVIPAFGVPLPVQRRLETIGCEIVDTSCGDVRRLWKWAEEACRDGFSVLIFGRATHDETVVTKSRLAAAGGKYVVAGNLDQVRQLCELVTGQMPAARFPELFGSETTNAESLRPLRRLAQVSQTTMLYDDTVKVRHILTEAFEQAFSPGQLDRHLRFQHTVCLATQARQSAAVKLCKQGCDVAIVVGGFTSSNTRHLFELAKGYLPAYFIESAESIRSADLLETYDFAADRPAVATGWLPRHRPLRIGVLAGASSPEIVVGQVLEKLAAFLS